MYKIPANTLFIGKQLVFVPECHSTNTLALQMTQNKSATEGTVVITNNQTAGRGQRGTSWESDAGMNLTFSIILMPGFLAPKDQYYLTIFTSLALRDYLEGKIHPGVTIKWPNDILVHEKKICGILIENQVQGSHFIATVIGIGLNINQTRFAKDTATSLKLITNREIALEQALHELLGYVEARYIQLRQGKWSDLREEYLSHLYWRKERHRFSSGLTNFEGVIKGVDDSGKLIVETSEGLSYFGNKEITFIQ